MNVHIILTIAGTDTGPFDLYSDVGGFATAFESGVSKASLVAGYNATPPDGATQIKVVSTGNCTSFVIIDIGVCATTTTTSSSSTTTSSTSSTSTTTTSSTSSTSTTTTTTTTYVGTTTTTTTHFPVYNYLGTTSSYNNYGDACSFATCSRPYYRDIPAISDGLILYDDAELTIPHDGGGLWIAINDDYNSCTGPWYAVQVDAYGVISNLTHCS